MIFGGINHERYTGNLNYHKVVDKRFFSVELQDVLLDGKSLGYCNDDNIYPRCRAAPDSGSTSLGVPKGFKDIMDQKFGHASCTENEWMNDGVLTFLIDGIHYDLQYNHFIRRIGEDPTHKSDAHCMPAMVVMKFERYPGLENLFILGDAFMSTYFTVFDREKDRVGFATAKHTSDE